MFEFLRYEGAKRVRGGLYLSAGLSVLAVIAVWAFPAYDEAIDMDELLKAFPEPLLRALRIETMASLEGFLAVELYMFGWVILLGLYLAYSAAGLIADDLDRGRLELLLAMPISRTRLAAEKFAALGVPVLIVNAVTPVVVIGTSILIGDPLRIIDVLLLHLWSIPYLFACAGIGLFASVWADRGGVAERIALGTTFGLYLLESLLAGTDFEWIGLVAPMRYFNPNDALVGGDVPILDVAVLCAMVAVLFAASAVWFNNRDL